MSEVEKKRGTWTRYEGETSHQELHIQGASTHKQRNLDCFQAPCIRSPKMVEVFGKKKLA
jgi:hypothetical protein